MSNGLNEEPSKLPQTDAKNQYRDQTRGHLTDQFLERLAKILFSQIQLLVTLMTAVLAQLLRQISK